MMDEKLSYRIFRTQEAPKAVVFCVHGMQEYQKRYEGFAKYLNSREIACITYDLPGHGPECPKENLGYFGDKDGWFNLVNSAVGIARLAHKEFPDVPVIYFGHSMGTMIGRTFLQDYDTLIDGMILSGAPNYIGESKAAIGLAKIIAGCKGKKAHSKTLASVATGGNNKGIENPRTPLDWLSYNQLNVDAYIADPLCGFSFTNQGYLDLFKGMNYMHDPKWYHCTKPNMPIWFFSGKDDPCRGGDAGFNDSIATIKNAGYKNVTSTLYPGMRHETMHEKDADKVMKAVADWVLDKTKK